MKGNIGPAQTIRLGCVRRLVRADQVGIQHPLEVWGWPASCGSAGELDRPLAVSYWAGLIALLTRFFGPVHQPRS
jgi:hypothetical protein